MANIKFIAVSRSLSGILDYVTNREKTVERLISGVNCMAQTAQDEFEAVKKQFRKTDGRSYYHIVQAFAPDDPLDFDTAHEIGLVARLLPPLRAMAESYRLPGLDRDDLVQEGFLGVMSAVRHYHPGLGEFTPYALTCARNSMGSAARAALSDRHQPLRDYDPIPEDHPAGEEIQPQALVEAAEFSGELHRWMQTELTDYERQVFRLFLAGYPYSEIASLLSSHSKAVDNALQRVRRKLRKFYSTHSVSA